MRNSIPSALVAALLLFIAVPAANAFTGEGCGSGACTDCHNLTRDEAAKILARGHASEDVRKILGGNVDNVLSVGASPVGGLWEVAVEKAGQRWPLYIDFSKEYVIAGQIVQLSTKKNLTGSRMLSMNRVDVSQIPLAGSIVVGKTDAKRRIVVFDDPNCPHCAKLHETAKEIVAKHPDVAFFVRPFPRNGDRPTYETALSIVCAGTAQALEDAFAGKFEYLRGSKLDAESIYRDILGRVFHVSSQVTGTLNVPVTSIISAFFPTVRSTSSCWYRVRRGGRPALWWRASVRARGRPLG